MPEDCVSSSCSPSCSKSILHFPKNLEMGNNETALKSFMKEVLAEHKLT